MHSSDSDMIVVMIMQLVCRGNRTAAETRRGMDRIEKELDQDRHWFSLQKRIGTAEWKMSPSVHAAHDRSRMGTAIGNVAVIVIIIIIVAIVVVVVVHMRVGSSVTHVAL